MNNPLLTPFETAPFSKIKNEHFSPAIKHFIAVTRTQINEISENKEAPTFKNTIEALDCTGLQLDRISSIFFNLNSAETNDEIQKIAQEVSPLLSDFRNDLLLNEKLFQRVKQVYDFKSSLSLNSEQNMLLEKQYKSFARNGANLSDKDKEILREIDGKLSKLKLKFGENVLAETNKFYLQITHKRELSGLPEGVIEMAAQTAKEKKMTGWIFTLDYPSYVPFVTYSNQRELRKKITVAFGQRSFNNNENDNQSLVLEIVNLRHQRAQVLGYFSHAHFVLEERMAKTPEKVLEFLYELLEKAKPAAQSEFKKLEDFAKELDGIDQLEKWDAAYYSEKLKQKLFDLDDEKLKPYFKLENVIEGVFEIANKLYQLNFKEVYNLDTYHEDVKTYEVTDQNNNFIALFYADFHPRAGKRSGAWMTSFKAQYKSQTKNERPHISNVCNFTKPTKSKPSLLSFNEVTTLFHEFGHGLHGMLANTTYKGLSGTNVSWDFVELPSQLLENWCYEKEALELFAKHYKSEQIIPMELINKIKASATFHEGMQTLRQISLGLLDIAWHGEDPSSVKNVKEFETLSFSATQLYPDVKENCMSTSFSHIFQGGYSAGYYSYKWAEVLDADAFKHFKDHGIFNNKIAAKFKNTVLSQGGTCDPLELYIKFKGSKPNPEALLKRAGLI
jgi:Zn-dependent oligopeptidase